MIKRIPWKDYFTWKELADAWEINDRGLDQYSTEFGLRRYRDLTKIYDPDCSEPTRKEQSREEIKNNIKFEQGLSWILPPFLAKPFLTDEQIDQLVERKYDDQRDLEVVDSPEDCIVFKSDDIKELQDEHPGLFPERAVRLEFVQGEIIDQSTADFIEESDSAIKNHENVFRRIGDNWLVKYEGKKTTRHDLKRLHYVIHLLDKPHDDFNVLYLSKLVKGNEVLSIEESYSKMNKEQLAGLGLSLSDSLPTEDLDKKEKDRIEDIVTECWEKLENTKKSGNSLRIKKVEDEWKKLQDHLHSEYGVKVSITSQGVKYIKYLPKLQKEAERARSKVVNQINDVIQDFRKSKDMPSLGEHLDKYITRKTKCVYEPPSDTPPWYISW